jgi:hypothetical protein
MIFFMVIANSVSPIGGTPTIARADVKTGYIFRFENPMLSQKKYGAKRCPSRSSCQVSMRSFV